jgi:hypothetical protein
MKGIEQIYYNDFGMSFYWKEKGNVKSDKIQLVFKETGFYFSVAELQHFVVLIQDSSQKNNCCKNCEMQRRCTKFLLKTPVNQIDLAVSMQELECIHDLVQGTLFRIRLEEYIYGDGMN